MDRRDFIKTLGIMGASTLPVSTKAETVAEDKEFVGVLVDLTRCVGCQTCTETCAETWGLPEPDLDAMDEVETPRNTTDKQWTLVNSFEVDGEEYYVKKQCMHCNQPACATACPTKAMLKTKEGPVIWRSDKCMGCRFCMVSCPFEIPKFEYDSNMPKIQKCRMCFERLQEGEQPACVEECPEEALMFGTRRELIEEANRRIYENPDDYVHEIYGEHEVGGTGYLYIAPVPFEKLGFRTDLGKTPYPEYTKTFLYSVPLVITLWPPLLLALNKATQKDDKEIEGGDNE